MAKTVSSKRLNAAVSKLSKKEARTQLNGLLRSGKTTGAAARAKANALSNRIGNTLVYNKKGNITGHVGGGGRG